MLLLSLTLGNEDELQQAFLSGYQRHTIYSCPLCLSPCRLEVSVNRGLFQLKNGVQLIKMAYLITFHRSTQEFLDSVWNLKFLYRPPHFWETIWSLVSVRFHSLHLLSISFHIYNISTRLICAMLYYVALLCISCPDCAMLIIDWIFCIHLTALHQYQIHRWWFLSQIVPLQKLKNVAIFCLRELKCMWSALLATANMLNYRV